MNILLPIDRIGDAGIGTVTRDLCRFLPEALSSQDRLLIVGSKPPCTTAGNVRHVVTRAPPRSRVARFVHEQAVLTRAARRADLVHLPDPRALLTSPQPFMVTVHDLFVLDNPEWYPRIVRSFKASLLNAALSRGPRHIVCVSSFTRDRLLAHRPDVDVGRVHVISPGVEPADAPRMTDAGGDYFLTLSTIERRKNHLTLLRAFQQARADGLQLRWKVAGAPLYGSTPVVRALRATPGVEVLGLVADGQREQLYRDAAFVASPSHSEGFGFVPLEAMARGVPVACSAGSALDETAGHAALRVDAGDARGWARALRRLADDRVLRDDLRHRGLDRVRRFDQREAAERYAQLYRSSS